MNKKKVSKILNILIILLVVIGLVIMITGYEFMGKSKILTSTNISVLKYFTVESNIFACLTSIIYLLKKRKKNKYISILKLSSTTCLTITFLVTALYLAPFNNYPFIEFYKNSNLFFHLVVPILSIISYLFFDEVKVLKNKDIILCLIPYLLYSCFYTINVLTHMSNNKVLIEYDFYGFLKGGIKSIIIVIPIMFITTYLITYFLNRLKDLFTSNKC